MVLIDYEVIVKYNGDILRLKDILAIEVEILSDNFAIITSEDSMLFDELLNYSEIEYIERPFILETQDEESFSASGITSFKNRTDLTGKNVLIGLIDSGIDYTLPVFRDENGNSKILYYWDQSIGNNPPAGFKEGTLYDNSMINEAINGSIDIPISITASHGTHVGSICAQIATEARFLVVRVGNRQTDIYSRSTEFMRAIKFILDKALELNMPVAINISYGTNEGSHRGHSLFEQYIDEMCLYWKNNIVVAAGNNGNKSGHKRIDLTNTDKHRVEFVVGNQETVLNINIWPNFVDEFTIYIENPSNDKSQILSADNKTINNNLRKTEITGVFYEIMPYSIQRRITIRLSSDTQITPGIWKIIFSTVNITDGIVDLYLPTSEGLSPDTRFLSPSGILTVTVPGTSRNVITVGSYNSTTDIVSAFSGRGDINLGIYKPDLLAPGENIISYMPGGTMGGLTGTSMAAPHVTGCCALLMEWGIVQKNDLYLYSQKLKATLLQNTRMIKNNTYPSSSSGYGFLDMSGIYLNRNREKKLLRGINRQEDSDIFIDSSFIYFDDEAEFFKRLREYDLFDKFTKLSDNSGILNLIDINLDVSERFFSVSNIVRIENLIEMSLLTDVYSFIESGVTVNEEANISYIKNNQNLDITGRNVLIAIADTGIDYLHPDFIYPDGTSKIVYLWDQTKNDNPPEGFLFGTEYTREDINRAIRENNSLLSNDEVGSGTMLSGICCGLGNSDSRYQGIAVDSELIIIKLGKIDDKYNNAYYYLARDYARKKAKELGRSLVINTSIGSNSNVGLVNRSTEATMWYQYKEFEIAGAGNQGNTETHKSGVLTSKDETHIIEIEVEQTEPVLQIQLWVSRPDRINFKIISPTGEESGNIGVGYYSQESGLFNFENTSYRISVIFPTAFSGQEFVTIQLFNATPGIWKLSLTGVYINRGQYNIYLPNRKLINQNTRFVESDPFYTINFPAIDRNIFTVGAYDTVNNSIWPLSSRGPNIQGYQKPNIVAPGVNLIAPYKDSSYKMISGTGAAAAFVSGVAALFLEYIQSNKNYKRQGFIQSVFTYFEMGAKREENIEYPNLIYGYGLLDVRGIFEEFR